MNIAQLQHFVALAETRSFSRASETVHVTQSALSRSIQMLEQELGLPLVDRIGKQNELTPFGRLVLAQAQQIVLQTAELKRAAASMAEGVAGDIRLGVGSAPSALFAAPLMTHMLREFPKVRVQLLGGSPEMQLAQLRARQVDGLLLTYRAVPPAPDLRVEVLPALRSGFLCRAGHPLGEGQKVRFKELRSFPLLSTKVSDDAARTLVERYGAAANPHTWMQHASEDVASLLRTVQATDALFLGVIAVAQAQWPRDALREVMVSPEARLQAQFAFVTLNGRAEPPALAVIRDFCKALVDTEVAAGR